MPAVENQSILPSNKLAAPSSVVGDPFFRPSGGPSGQQASRRLTAVTRLETLFLLKSVRGATDGPTPTHPTTEPLSCFAGARGDLEGVVGVAGG